jgi:hypothetical protein
MQPDRFTPTLRLPQTLVYTLKSDMLRLESVDRQIVDVRRVLEILATPPWPHSQLVSHLYSANAPPVPTGLDLCEDELMKRQLEGSANGGTTFPTFFGGGYTADQIDSPFWVAVKDAKMILQDGLYYMQRGIPRVANSGSHLEFRPTIPGGDGQVEAVFPLITLLFATFDIPVPANTTALWAALTTKALRTDRTPVPVFECIDLTTRTPLYAGSNKDRHHLKENLRHGIFHYPNLTRGTPPAIARFMAAHIPWADDRGPDVCLLARLVGAVRRMQAHHNTAPTWDPLEHVRTHCEAALQPLYIQREQLRASIQQDTAESVTRPPLLTEQEKGMLRALARRPQPAEPARSGHADALRAMHSLLQPP